MLLVLTGLLHLTVFWSVIWISTFVADSIFFFSTGVRWFVLIVNSTLSLYLFHIFIGQHLKHLIRSRNKSYLYTETAREIGRLKPDIADRLVNAYQLQNTKETYSSPDLRRFAVDRFADAVCKEDFRSLLSPRSFIIPFSWIFLILTGGIFLTFFMGDQLFISLKRVFDPMGEYQVIQDFSFQVMPGDTTIIAGHPLDIIAAFSGPSVERLKIEIIEQKNKEQYAVNLEKKGLKYFTTIKGMHSDFIYYLTAVPLWEVGQQSALKSNRFKVAVITPPAVNDLQISLTPPAYTGLAKIHLEPNIGDIMAYVGSEVELTARSNKEIKSAELVFFTDKPVHAQVRGQLISAKFIITQSGAYYLHLTDNLNIPNTDPIKYQIEAMEDLAPTITLVDPGQDIDISPDAAINLIFEGRDDFGFSRMWLSYQIIGSMPAIADTIWHRIPLQIPSGQNKFFQQQFLWQFSKMATGFGDAIKYYLALSDNDRINGPKTSYSSTYMINFPTIDQVFAAADQKQQESIEENEQISEESERLRENLEQITREMKREKEINWERQKQIESALNKQQEIQQKLDKIQENLEEAIRKLDQSNMISPEILEKYQQLQQLFQEIASPELLQAIQNLQDALEKMDEKQIEKSLQDFKLNQEKFAEELERTLELFRKVQFEQEIDRLSKMADKAVQNQEMLSEDLSKRLNPDEQLQRQQQQDELMKVIEENLDQLLQNDLMSRYPEAQQQLNETAQQLKSGEFDQLSEDLKEQLRSGEQNKAIVKSNELMQQLDGMRNQISQAKKTILDADRKNISAQLQKSSANLLNLSQQQESLMNKTADAGSLSDQFKDLAGEQQQIAMNMRRVIEDMVKLSRETFMLAPEIGQSMANAGQGMRKSLSELENRNKAGAGNAQKEAMGALNRAVLEMQSTMESMSAGGSALGFEQFMERMQQMSGQQGQLNQEAMNFLQGQGKNPGVLSSEAQQQLQRMAAEQRALQKSMEQLNDEMGGRSDVMGRLDNITGEMEEVVKDLELLQMDRRTIERQQKILSRMLDAQKSMREQEYSRQRQAETAKTYTRKAPDPRQEREDRDLKRLQDELMRALQEGYNPDYEKIIEEYFRILSEKYLEEKNRNQ